MRKHVKPVKESTKEVTKEVAKVAAKLAILVSANSSTATDIGFFLPNVPWVREVTPGDAVDWANGEFTAKHRSVLNTMRDVQRALRAKSTEDVLDLFERLGTPLREKIVKLSPTVALKVPPMPMFRGSVAFAQCVTRGVRDARLVIRLADQAGKFVPAIYCPDKIAAVWCHMLIQTIRICPECETLFAPRAGNISFCSRAHGENYRVKQWQAAQRVKAKATKATKARGA